MKVTIRQRQDIVIADLTGDLTTADGATLLRERVKQLLGRGTRKLILNLANIRLMDSSGLGELGAAANAARTAGAELKLLHVHADLRQVIELAQMADAFEMYDDEIAVMLSFR